VIPLLKGFLAEDVKIDVFPVEGNLSRWIRDFRKEPAGFSGMKLAGKGKEALRFASNLVELIEDFFDPRKRDSKIEKVEAYFPPKTVRQLEAAITSRDSKAVNLVCNSIGRQAGIAIRFDVVGLLTRLRALKATALCLLLYSANPLDLLQQVSRGDKHAALCLARTDKLFLLEPPLAKMIREATLLNDKRFLNQIARAQLRPTMLRGKDLHRFIIYALLAANGKLPKLVDLFYMLDPDGTTFRTTEAFEKFCERCKKDFYAMRDGSPT